MVLKSLAGTEVRLNDIMCLWIFLGVINLFGGSVYEPNQTRMNVLTFRRSCKGSEDLQSETDVSSEIPVYVEVFLIVFPSPVEGHES